MIFNSRLETIVVKLFDRSKHREFRLNTFITAKQPHQSMRMRWTSLGASLLVAACGSTVDPGKNDPPPSTTLSAARPMVAAGTSSTLMWQSTNTTSCTASGGWSGSRPTSGSESTGALVVDTSFSLTCARADGINDVATATVKVVPAATVTLAANPTPLALARVRRSRGVRPMRPRAPHRAAGAARRRPAAAKHRPAHRHYDLFAEMHGGGRHQQCDDRDGQSSTCRDGHSRGESLRQSPAAHVPR